MSTDDDDFDALARTASQADSSSAEDRARPMFDQSVIAKMVAEIADSDEAGHAFQ